MNTENLTMEDIAAFASARAFYCSVVLENDMVIKITKDQAIHIMSDKYKRFRLITCVNEKAEPGVMLFQSGDKLIKNIQN